MITASRFGFRKCVERDNEQTCQDHTLRQRSFLVPEHIRLASERFRDDTQEPLGYFRATSLPQTLITAVGRPDIALSRDNLIAGCTEPFS